MVTGFRRAFFSFSEVYFSGYRVLIVKGEDIPGYIAQIGLVDRNIRYRAFELAGIVWQVDIFREFPFLGDVTGVGDYPFDRQDLPNPILFDIPHFINPGNERAHYSSFCGEEDTPERRPPALSMKAIGFNIHNASNLHDLVLKILGSIFQ